MAFEKLKERFQQSKWCKIYLILACLQAMSALALLIPAFLHVRQISDTGLNYYDLGMYYDKAIKVSGECIMFIVFELWRLWLALDGVIRLNSRTIYASASFTILSFLFSIMLVAESVNWIHAINEMQIVNPANDILRLINQYLQIALVCVIFLLIVPTFWTANRLTKDFGWDVYKKIGSSISIQEMYIDLQWLSLMLKIDFFFEFVSYILLLLYQQLFNLDLRLPISLADRYILVAFIVLLLPSFMLCRFSISKESNLLMSVFIAIQLAFLAYTVYILVITIDVATSWYAYMMYSLGVLIAALVTIGLSIKCQRNFKKGLKEFVQWHPWRKGQSTRHRSSTFNTYQTDELRGLYVRRADAPIDDDD